MTLAEVAAFDRRPRTAAELAQAVLRALAWVQAERIDGEYSEPGSLWDRVHARRPAFRPKSEDELSYWLRNRLAEHLPDVEIRRESDIAAGRNRADLHISLRFGDASLVVVLEAKGCWHSEAVSGVRDQLVGRYLARMPDAAGIHLVWWFDPARWDPADGRRRNVRAAYRDAPDGLAAALDAEVEGLRSQTGRDVFGYVLRVSDAPPPLVSA